MVELILVLTTKITHGNINEIYDIDRNHASPFVRSQYFAVCLDHNTFFSVCLDCNKNFLTANIKTAYSGFVLLKLLTEGITKISSLLFYPAPYKVSFVIFHLVTGESPLGTTFMSDVYYHPLALW